jgi:hypothetical protein
LYETNILLLLQGAGVESDVLLDTLAQHVAPDDVAELLKLVQELQARRRFS